MQKRSAATMFLAAALVALGGCGSDGSGTTGPVFSDSASTVETAGFALGAQWLTRMILDRMNGDSPDITPAFAETAFRGRSLPERARELFTGRTPVPSGTRGSLAALLAASPVGCTLTARGTFGGTTDFVDVNGNGIPDDLYVQKVCTYADSGSDTTVVDHLTQVVQVQEIAASQYGYTRSITYRLSRVDGSGNTLDALAYDESETLDQRPQQVTHTGRSDYRESSMVDGATVEGTGGFDFSAVFIPTGTGAVVTAPPDSLPDGKLTITGHNYRTSPDGRNLWFELSTPTPLVYARSCAVESSGITGGTIRGVLNNKATQATFTTTYDGCDGYATNYTGTQD